MKKKWVEIAFEIGDTVYLKTDVDKHKRMVTGLSIKLNTVVYELVFGTTTSWHYDFEITSNVEDLQTL